jgi:hypothetical protein
VQNLLNSQGSVKSAKGDQSSTLGKDSSLTSSQRRHPSSIRKGDLGTRNLISLTVDGQTASGASSIQREAAAATTGGKKPATLALSSVRLWHLLEYTIMITNPSGMNSSAVSLLKRLAEAGKMSSELRHEVDYLQYAEQQSSGKEGELSKVQGARGAIGKASKGRRGEYMQNKIAEYVDSAGEIREKLPLVKAAQTGIRQAAAQLKSVAAAGKVKKAERTKEKADANLAALNAKMARAKSLANGLIGPASDLLQGKWADAGISLAKFIGAEIISAGVEMAYDAELRQAKAELAQAKKDLVYFQDAKQAADLEAAAQGLKKAKLKAEAAQQALMTVVLKANRAHMNLVEALENIGQGGAAGAIDMRADILETSASATMKIMQYEELAKRIEKHSKGLRALNYNLSDFMLSPGGESTVKNVMHRNRMKNHADMNVKELERIEKWVKSELISIGTVKGYLEGQSYLKDFEKIPTTLSEAVANR